tara:strand:- start:13084 stop:13938 length:855 start_codon:yes stop_codon:yes gene_type:complete
LSRNKDRTGGTAALDEGPPAPLTTDTGGGGFSFVVPTEFVELPSQGKFYPEGHPLRGQSSIEVRQMTAKEEDILTSKTLLKKNVALDRVLQNLIVEPSINADHLLIGDRNALIVAIRVSGYGNEYNTSIMCPRCTATQKYAFDLNTAGIFEGDPPNENITHNGDGTFTTKLPKSGVSATFRLLNGADERNLLAGINLDKKQKIHERTITRQILNIVTAVNGDDSSDALNYLVQNIPSSDSRHLRLAYKSVAPNIDLTQDFECTECGHETELEVPLTADFFWPDR